jgi:uncharacterized HhH-GPD family protein
MRDPGEMWERIADMHLAYTPEANELLTDDPFALLIGMLLDQQIPMEKAFTSPHELQARLGGTLDAATIAGYDPEAFEELFRTPPALHRFPAAMAKRVQELARVISSEYGDNASAIWAGVSSGDELVARLAKLPGFGEQKAKIFAALLGKQLGVQPSGWREAAGPYGDDGVFRSVADVVDDSSLTKVRSYKQQLKAAAKAK